MHCNKNLGRLLLPTLLFTSDTKIREKFKYVIFICLLLLNLLQEHLVLRIGLRHAPQDGEVTLLIGMENRFFFLFLFCVPDEEELVYRSFLNPIKKQVNFNTYDIKKNTKL